MITHSPQQETIFRWGRDGAGNAIIIAVAGAGKTHTLVELCKSAQGSIVFCAFNKKIADEIGRRLAGIPNSKYIKAATFHSLGLRAWSRVAPFAQVEGEKLEDLMEDAQVPKHLRAFVKRLVSLGKQVMITEFEDTWSIFNQLVDHHDMEEMLYNEYSSDIDKLRNQGVTIAKQILTDSIALNDKVIDFDDMIFAPLHHGVDFPKNDWVLIDEAQDTNPARRAMAAAMLADSGRLVAVGDPHQAIYGFTGADSDALDLIADEFNAQRLPLTITYRCPKSVVRRAQTWVSHIQAAPTAPEGVVREIALTDFNKITPEPTDVILCRNTKPLIEMALGFIRRRVAAHVEGRDIGAGLLALVNKWKSAQTIEQLRDKLEEYESKEILKLQQKRMEYKIHAVRDKLDSIRVIMDTMQDDDSVSTLANTIRNLFLDSEGRQMQSITLSTIHKAKGREWDRVYLYGRDKFMPSPYAILQWQKEQENNLCYVAVTRAKRELVEVFVSGAREEA